MPEPTSTAAEVTSPCPEPDCEFTAGHLSEHPCGQPSEPPGTPCRHCGKPVPMDGEPCPDCWLPFKGTPLADIKAMFADIGLSVSREDMGQ